MSEERLFMNEGEDEAAYVASLGRAHAKHDMEIAQEQRARLSEWKPFTYEDGTEVHLMSFNGAGDGTWSHLCLTWIEPGGQERTVHFAAMTDDEAPRATDNIAER